LTYNTERRRLFRDPDDHLISGVAQALPIILTLTQPGYGWPLLSWCLLPQWAFHICYIMDGSTQSRMTRADRMAMKGEKQDLKGFKKNFEEELSSVRENLQNFKHEAKPFIYQVRDLISDIFEHLAAFLKGTGSLLAKLLAAAVLLTCLGTTIALIISLIALFTAGNMGIYNLFPFNIANHQANGIFMFSGFLVLTIPLLAIILSTIGFLFKKASFNRSIGTTLLCIWLASIGAVSYYGVKTAANFREGGKFTQTIKLKPTANNTYHLQLNDTKYLSNEDSTRLKINERFKGMIILDDDFNGNNMEGPNQNVTIDIEKSDVQQPVLIETFSARGSSLEEALINARSTSYRFEQKDSVLNFDRHLETPKGFLWRGQELRLTLKVPLNAKIIIDEKLDRNITFNIYECKNDGDGITTATYIMTANGLECKVDPIKAAKFKADSLKALKEEQDTIPASPDTATVQAQ
jgi:hypothetical protein